MWIWVIIFVLAAAAGLLLLRVRIRCEIRGSEKRMLFIGLGRSGADLDIAAKTGRVKVLGLSVKSFELSQKESSSARAAAAKKDEPGRPKKRKRSFRIVLRALPETAQAVWSYLLGLLRTVVVEELEGEIEAGFDQPHLTGLAFGYYQAALAAIPTVVGRLEYRPVWTGSSFTGAVRVGLAIPLYRLVWRTTVLLIQLPLIKLVKLAIGEKRGDQDGQ